MYTLPQFENSDLSLRAQNQFTPQANINFVIFKRSIFGWVITGAPIFEMCVFSILRLYLLIIQNVGVLNWIDGWPLHYTNWGWSDPKGLDCAVMQESAFLFKPGEWSNTVCSKKMYTPCKYNTGGKEL